MVRDLTRLFFVIFVFFPLLLISVVYANDAEGENILTKEPFQTPKVTLTEEEQTFHQSLISQLTKSSTGKKILEDAERMGYQFGGMLPTDDGSTYPEYRVIKIGKSTKDARESVLTFSYELCNVVNSDKYMNILALAGQKKISKEKYARKMLELEARAVCLRSQVAKELDLSFLDSYSAVVTSLTNAQSQEQVFQEIVKDMQETGCVVGKCGLESVTEFYMKQYDEL